MGVGPRRPPLRRASYVSSLVYQTRYLPLLCAYIDIVVVGVEVNAICGEFVGNYSSSRLCSHTSNA